MNEEMEVPQGGQEEMEAPKKKGRFFVVEHLFAGCQHIAHPDVMLGGAKDIALGPYEAKVVSYEDWKDSPYLDQCVDEDRVKTYWSDKRPAAVPNLPPEAPMKVSQRNAIWSIAFGAGKIKTQMASGDVVEEDVATMLINLVPEETTSYQGPGRDRTVLTSDYLKKEHYETLHWAKWLIENFPRSKHKKRIRQIEKRMAEIEQMP